MVLNLSQDQNNRAPHKMIRTTILTISLSLSKHDLRSEKVVIGDFFLSLLNKNLNICPMWFFHVFYCRGVVESSKLASTQLWSVALFSNNVFKDKLLLPLCDKVMKVRSVTFCYLSEKKILPNLLSSMILMPKIKENG